MGFGSVWVPSSGDHRLYRVDAETNLVTAQIQTTIRSREGGIAVSDNSVWLMANDQDTLLRV